MPLDISGLNLGNFANLAEGDKSPASLLTTLSAVNVVSTAQKLRKLPEEIAALTRPAPVGLDIASIAGFNLDVLRTHSHTFGGSVTEYPVESGDTYTDNMIIAPQTYTLTAMIGEVFIKAPRKPFLLSNFLPDRSQLPPGLEIPGIEQVPFAEIENLVDSTAAQIDQLKDFNDDGDKPRIENGKLVTRRYWIVGVISAFRNLKIPFTIISPWRIIENVLIESFSVTENDGEYSSTITLNMKEIRIAETALTEYDPAQFQGRAGQSVANIEEGGLKSDESILYQSPDIIRNLIPTG